MAYMLVVHRVKNFADWKRKFDAHGDARAAAGCKGGQLLRSEADPNEIIIVHKWDSVTNARKFVESRDLQEAIKAAGVLGKPKVYYLEEIENFKK